MATPAWRDGMLLLALLLLGAPPAQPAAPLQPQAHHLLWATPIELYRVPDDRLTRRLGE
jgi:hypothetical protein